MNTRIRVLIVEDSEDDALLLARELRYGGYDLEFERVDTAESMQVALEQQTWDLIITDHNMPRFNSEDALKLFKDYHLDIPFIIISGSIGEEYVVAAMKAGAHDYLMKGNLARLVPAVQRELREVETRRAHRRAEEAIRHMAFHDALTDLTNRREFECRLEHALESARRDHSSHACLYLDLDQFKIINDTCGHVAGDDLLRQLAVLFQKHVRNIDTLARLGGDEFGVLLENCPIEQAQRIAENFRQVIAEFRFVWRERPFGISVSIGLVPITAASRNVNGILSAADMACYAAKNLGRNRVHLYNESDIGLARRHGDIQWVPRIKQALEDDQFRLYRQSIVPLSGYALGTKSFEFLLRYIDTNNNAISPGTFIPAAEHYNLMPKVDRWVIQHAFSYLAEAFRNNGGLKESSLFFINLSENSLSDDEVYPFIKRLLHDYRIPPHVICFEITETAAITNLGKAVEFIKKIKDHGCQFALDDFGSGLSSFSYLKTIPVDFLKIEGGFIRNMLDDPMNSAIVEAINQIGHVAGIRTIAEFVETGVIKQKLKSIGVDYAQGYGIGYPVSLEM